MRTKQNFVKGLPFLTILVTNNCYIFLPLFICNPQICEVASFYLSVYLPNKSSSLSTTIHHHDTAELGLGSANGTTPKSRKVTLIN